MLRKILIATAAVATLATFSAQQASAKVHINGHSSMSAYPVATGVNLLPDLSEPIRLAMTATMTKVPIAASSYKKKKIWNWNHTGYKIIKKKVWICE